MEDLDLTQIQTTTESRELADKLAEGLLNAKLCACVKIISDVSSSYHWKGNIENANEQLLLITTTSDQFSEVEKYITKNHSYETPEILAVKISGVSADYGDWIKGELRDAQKDN